MCLSYSLPWFEPNQVILWHCAHPEIGVLATPIEVLYPLFDWIRSGGLIEAHNSTFEEYIWRHVCAPRMGWPRIKNSQWRDSAAKAAAASLPRDLGGVGEALNLPVKKDKRGKELLRKYTQPKRLTKLEKELHGKDAILWNEDLAGLMELWDYNKQDVRAERRVSMAVPDLSPTELAVWQVTCKMNRRGVLIDVDLCKAALAMVAQARDKLNKELEEITGVEKGSQRKAVSEWLEAEELIALPDTTAKTLEWYLERGPKMSARARRVIEIVREVNRTSPNKYKRMLACVDKDNRARDLLVYCGAERTGRWAGRGIQVHNLPKGNLPYGLNMDHACEDVKSGDFAWCELIYGDVMNLIVSCLRGCIIAPSGRELITADYSAIEARCVLWLAGASIALQIFRDGGDIYCDMATGIFGRLITKQTARVITTDGKTERDFGKIAVLGLGYGMGYIKFLTTMHDNKIYLDRETILKMMGRETFEKYEAIVTKKLFPKESDFEKHREPKKSFRAAQRDATMQLRKLAEEREDARAIMHELALCKYTVDAYRSRYSEVPAQWKAQENAAIAAIQTGKAVKCGLVVWKVVGRFLKCKLPSGRCLHYCDPELKIAKTSWGESKPSIRFMGRDQKTRQWTRQATYGGKIVENG